MCFKCLSVINVKALVRCFQPLRKGSLNDDRYFEEMQMRNDDRRYYIEETNLLGAAGLLDQGEVDPHPRRARVAAPYLVWAKSASSIFNRFYCLSQIDMS